MRVTGAGMRVVVADDAFVFHRGGASFGSSRERYSRNRRIFDARWADRYPAEYDAFMKRNPLGYLRAELERGLIEDVRSPLARLFTAPSHTEHTAVGRLWTMTLDAWGEGGVQELARKLPVAPLRLAETARSLLRTMTRPRVAATHPARSRWRSCRRSLTRNVGAATSRPRSTPVVCPADAACASAFSCGDSTSVAEYLPSLT